MIDKFAGKHRFLSNFYPAVVTYKNMSFPTVEHAYVAAKVHPSIWDVLSSDDAHALYELIISQTAGDVKILGGKLELRPDWESIKLRVMAELLVQKFSESVLSAKLIATGSHELIEGNTWGDTYWGVCKGVGTNYLGVLLMGIREDRMHRSLSS